VRALADRLDEPAESVREAYRTRCSTIGWLVTLSLPGGATVTGEATGVDADGRLLVDGPQGRGAWAAGDVVHTRPGDGGPPPAG
jgi:BirA family biotin operon repressor/biotin-[acetyl-CoA-carboxylase] ligase